jgi:MbtH protein
MSNPFESDTADYLVLRNDEGQYSLWPVFKDIPRGWNAVGARGTRVACLAYIEENWKDMRPKSLILEMEGSGDDKSNKKAVS